MRDAATDEVESTLFRALAILRVVILLNSVGLAVYHHRAYDHPVVMFVVMGLLTLWTGITLVAYARPRWRSWPVLVADLTVAVVTMGISPWVKGEGMNATLPGFWVAGVMLAWAIRGRLVGGLAAAAVIAVVDVSVRDTFTQTNYANLFLLILGSTVVGYLTEQTTQMARDRMRAERTAAVTLERARLARVVHDGVLQVLALVQRRGTELGGEAAELGRLAGEQETALRTLVQRPDPVDDGPDLTRVDLSAALGALEARPSPRVQVTTPGGPVMMSADRVEEVVALVRACLHNISEHVAAEATAWILLEDLGERVVVTVRDDGPGIPEGRLEEAAAAGRLGVLESIRGRAGGLGGAAVLTTAPGAGTEWEFDLPKHDPAEEAR